MTESPRTIKCTDLDGRQVRLHVFGDSDRVVLLCPGGTSAVLRSREVGKLRGALRDAAMYGAVQPRQAPA